MRIPFYPWLYTQINRGNSIGPLVRTIRKSYSEFPDFPIHPTRASLRSFLLRHDSKLRGIEIFDMLYNMYRSEKDYVNYEDCWSRIPKRELKREDIEEH